MLGCLFGMGPCLSLAAEEADDVNCEWCGGPLGEGDRSCPRCGSPVYTRLVACPRCGASVLLDLGGCPRCGYRLGSGEPRVPPGAPSQTVPNYLRDMAEGETVVRDSGHFPVTCARGIVGSVSGRLFLTNKRVVFKAWKLQSTRGVYVTGLRIPNPADASKPREYVSIPLVEVVGVTSGWSTLTIRTGTGEYVFGGMHETEEWAEEIRGVKGILMSGSASDLPR